MSTAVTMSLGQKREALRCLTKVARYARKQIEGAGRQGSPLDTREHKGHDESSIDLDAESAILALLNRHFRDFSGTAVFEDGRAELFGRGNGTARLVLTIDEIDGTTNLKRALASDFTFPVSAAISLALGTSDRLGDVEVSIVHALDTGETFSAMRADDGDFLAFVDGRLLYPTDIVESRGDSNARVLIPGYSFKVRGYKAEVEEALMRHGLRRVYEGSRSSAMDIIGVVRNLNDAYVDVRALFGDEQTYGAMLQGYDVAGVIPIALGAGLRVESLAPEHPWQACRNQERVAIAIGRPKVIATAIEAMAEVPSPTDYLAAVERAQRLLAEAMP